MASDSTTSLPKIIKRYGEVADKVNRREVKRYIDEIGKRSDPPPPEEDYRYEGWTHEGALTRCIYDEAIAAPLKPQAPQRGQPGVCQAEWEKQVQFRPTLDEIMDYVEKPPSDPIPQERRREILSVLKDGVRQQLNASGLSAPSTPELPPDLDILYATTDCIRQAGVPSETDFTCLVLPLTILEKTLVPNKMPSMVFLNRCFHSPKQRTANASNNSQMREKIGVGLDNSSLGVSCSRW